MGCGLRAAGCGLVLRARDGAFLISDRKTMVARFAEEGAIVYPSAPAILHVSLYVTQKKCFLKK